MAAAAAATIGLSTPAFAAITLSTYNGPDLTTKIKASTTNIQNDQQTVYGSTLLNGGSADVTFVGYRSDQSTPEAIHITDGAGFASITSSPNNATNQLYSILIDITSSDFNQYMFSIQLVNDGYITVAYTLASPPGGSGYADPITGLFQMANQNVDYILQGGTFTQIVITSTSPIKEFKQNSVTLGSVPDTLHPVPEPASWALMLLGFGGMGLVLRRGRRSGKPTLMQIA
jgi:hypothetical protein